MRNIAGQRLGAGLSILRPVILDIHEMNVKPTSISFACTSAQVKEISLSHNEFMFDTP
jgi:hypothetical protein